MELETLLDLLDQRNNQLAYSDAGTPWHQSGCLYLLLGDPCLESLAHEVVESNRVSRGAVDGYPDE